MLVGSYPAAPASKVSSRHDQKNALRRRREQVCGRSARPRTTRPALAVRSVTVVVPTIMSPGTLQLQPRPPGVAGCRAQWPTVRRRAWAPTVRARRGRRGQQTGGAPGRPPAVRSAVRRAGYGRAARVPVWYDARRSHPAAPDQVPGPASARAGGARCPPTAITGPRRCAAVESRSKASARLRAPQDSICSRKRPAMEPRGPNAPRPCRRSRLEAAAACGSAPEPYRQRQQGVSAVHDEPGASRCRGRRHFSPKP